MGLEEDVTTAIANSTDTRTAFVKGISLPPDEIVSLRDSALKLSASQQHLVLKFL